MLRSRETSAVLSSVEAYSNLGAFGIMLSMCTITEFYFTCTDTEILH